MVLLLVQLMIVVILLYIITKFYKNQKRFSIKSKNCTKSTKSNFISRNLAFFIPKPKLVFTILRQTFLKFLILTYFTLHYYILFKTNDSRYTIRYVLNWLILERNNQYLIILILKNIIKANICYKTSNKKLLIIFKPFEI